MRLISSLSPKIMLPIYQPLNNKFTFDSTLMKNEIDTLIRSYAEERTLPFNNGKSIYDPAGLLHIASDEDLNNTTKYHLDQDGNRISEEGKFKTYHVVNLTYLEEEPESLVDIYSKDDPKKRIFWHTYKKPFIWRKELENTYLKQCVEKLPLEYIQGVRLIYMKPPSIGQIHRDSHPLNNHKYFKEGFASISFNIDSGGGILTYLDRDNVQKQVDNSLKVFHFDDSIPHGVTPISSERYQLRIWGKLKGTIKDLL